MSSQSYLFLKTHAYRGRSNSAHRTHQVCQPKTTQRHTNIGIKVQLMFATNRIKTGHFQTVRDNWLRSIVKVDTAKEPLKKVASDDSTRQKNAKKRPGVALDLVVLNEHFEQFFNTVISSAVVFQRFPKEIVFIACGCIARVSTLYTQLKTDRTLSA